MCFRPVMAKKEKEKEKLCPNPECKKPNPPDATKCKFCGTELPKMTGPAGPGPR